MHVYHRGGSMATAAQPRGEAATLTVRSEDRVQDTGHSQNHHTLRVGLINLIFAGS